MSIPVKMVNANSCFGLPHHHPISPFEIQSNDRWSIYLKDSKSRVITIVKKKYDRLGVVAHACNSNTLGGWGRWITWGQELRPDWPTWWKSVSTRNTKISWAWWCTPVVPATSEAEAGELLEPRRRRLRWAKIVPLYSSLGNNSETPPQKKKNNNNNSNKLSA